MMDVLQLSHSSLSMFHSCPRKLEFRKFHNAVNREETVATIAGSAMHKAYQHYIVHKDKQQAIFTLMMELNTKYDETPLSARSIEACYATLLAMFDFYPHRQMQIAMVETSEGRKPAIEVPFKIRIKNFEIDGMQIEYIGFIDAIFYDPINDQYAVTDIKTTSRKLDDYTPQFRFSNQCLPYAFVIEAINKKPLTNLQIQYMNCVISLDDPKITKLEFIKSESEIIDWARGFAMDLQLIKLYAKNKWFPRRGESCMAFNRTCQFFDFCSSRDETLIQHMLSFEPKVKQEPFVPWFDIELELEGLN